MHGIGPFRDALDEKLDLAEWASHVCMVSETHCQGVTPMNEGRVSRRAATAVAVLGLLVLTVATLPAQQAVTGTRDAAQEQDRERSQVVKLLEELQDPSFGEEGRHALGC